MPLEKGSGHATIGRNIEEMEKSGHPRNQAVAAALREAGVPKARDTQLAGGMPSSGIPGPGWSANAAWKGRRI